jgi:hypothetical protein
MTEETMFKRLRHALLELLRGYPSYRFFGKIESYLKESHSSLSVLNKDGIIEFAPKEECEELNKKITSEQWSQLRAEGKKEPAWYRLAPRGIDLAISMINLEYSEKMLKFAQKTEKNNNHIINLTYLIIFIAIVTTILGFIQIYALLISV